MKGVEKYEICFSGLVHSFEDFHRQQEAYIMGKATRCRIRVWGKSCPHSRRKGLFYSRETREQSQRFR